MRGIEQVQCGAGEHQRLVGWCATVQAGRLGRTVAEVARDLLGLLAAGDPNGEVKEAWHAKEMVRPIYDITDANTAEQFVCELAIELQHESRPLEVRSLGRTLTRAGRPGWSLLPTITPC